MTYSQVIQPAGATALKGLLWPGLLVGSVIAAYTPTVLSLIDGPWQTEQEGHGPLIIAASLWLVWQARDKLRSAVLSPSPTFGWLVLLGGLAVLVASRNQDIWFLEVASLIPVLAGCVLLLAGWNVLWI